MTPKFINSLTNTSWYKSLENIWQKDIISIRIILISNSELMTFNIFQMKKKNESKYKCNILFCKNSFSKVVKNWIIFYTFLTNFVKCISFCSTSFKSSHILWHHTVICLYIGINGDKINLTPNYYAKKTIIFVYVVNLQLAPPPQISISLFYSRKIELSCFGTYVCL